MFYCMKCRKFLPVPGACESCGGTGLVPAAVHVEKPRPFLALVPLPAAGELVPSPPQHPELRLIRSDP